MDIMFKTNQDKDASGIDSILDREWLKTTFLLSDKEIQSNNNYIKWVRANRYRSTADHKITCTAPGMNLSCNPKPQFTRYADIRSKGKIFNRPNVTLFGDTSIDTGLPSNSNFGLGMGRYYSEAIDDTSQRIYLRFGVPQYSPIISFITGAFDIKRAALNNRGVIMSSLLEIVNIVTLVFAIIGAPLLTLSLGLIGLLSNNKRFYSLKPMMHLYWNGVEELVNTIMNRRTLSPNLWQGFNYKVDNTIGKQFSGDVNQIGQMHSLLGDIVSEKGRISVYGLALKAQRAFNRSLKADLENNDTISASTDFLDYPLKEGETTHDTLFSNKHGDTNMFIDYIWSAAYKVLGPENDKKTTNNKDNNATYYNKDPITVDQKTGNTVDLNIDKDSTDTIDTRIQKNIDDNKSWWNKYKEYTLSEITEGSAFAVFTVETTGSIGSSFSNSTKENALGQAFNGFSDKIGSTAQAIKQAAGIIPFLDDVISLAGDTAAITVSNATHNLANPLLALAYGLHVNLPKTWESSNANLPHASYKLRLMSPYGNAYSQLINIYLPLAMILAGGLPRATGGSSHTAPFICQLFDRGRVQISLGMIDSINVTRGTSNLAFSKTAQTNAIDIEFTVANLDESLNIDIVENGIFQGVIDTANTLIGGDKGNTNMDDYVNTLVGLDIYEQIYLVPKLRIKLAELEIRMGKLSDPAYISSNTIGALNFPKTIFGNSFHAISQLTGQ